MRFSPIILCSVLSLNCLHAQDLSPTDREALLEQLDKLENSAAEKIDARYRVAVTAYREAASSEEKAFALYIMSVEKVEYTDLNRKNQDFREWKKKEDANLGKLGFRTALRYQLRWLSLTLEAASSKPNQEALVYKAKECLNALFNDLKQMADQEQVLTQSVTSTVFAKAYGIDRVELKDWPRSPLNLEELYDKVILPPLRKPSTLAELRAGWMKRIEQELEIRDVMGNYAKKLQAKQDKENEAYQTKNSPNEKNTTYNETKIGMAENMHSPAYEEFKIKELPELLWKMEVDLFKSGDKVEGSKRMLAHIQKYLSHPSSKEWGTEFKQLLAPAAPNSETSPVPTAPPAGS